MMRVLLSVFFFAFISGVEGFQTDLSVLSVFFFAFISGVEGFQTDLSGSGITWAEFKELANAQPTMAYFGADWCDDCHRHLPIWKEVMTAFDDDADMLTTYIDCGKEEFELELCYKMQIESYPHYAIWSEDKHYEGETFTNDMYEGTDDMGAPVAESMIKYINDELVLECRPANFWKGCDEKHFEYVKKWSFKTPEQVADKLKQLQALKGGDMKEELARWLKQRIWALKWMIRDHAKHADTRDYSHGEL
jgi:thiol-disulfide isomerase/thioredoxin